MYYYSLKGAQTGPVSEEELRRLVATGQIASDTLVWREGMAEWQPFASALGGAATVVCSVCKQPFPVDQTIRFGDSYVCAGCKPTFVQGLREGVGTSQDKDLYKIALHQRRTLSSVGIAFLCGLIQGALMPVLPMLAPVIAIAALVAAVFCIISVYRLARSLGLLAIVYVLAFLIPCVGLLTVLYLASRATTRLKAAGVKVGFLGVSKAEIQRLKGA